MFQEAGRTYLLNPVDPNPSVGNWFVQLTLDHNVATECMYDLKAGLDCGYRFIFLVKYTKINCCDPACLNGGTCLDTGTCSCINFWEGDACNESNKKY
jgi:hypothetical protein